MWGRLLYQGVLTLAIREGECEEDGDGSDGDPYGYTEEGSVLKIAVGIYAEKGGYGTQRA